MKIGFCFSALAALSLTGCLEARPSECHSTVLAPLRSVSGPKTVAVNQPATYAISYELEGPCGKFNSLSDEATASPNLRIVGVKVDYEGCNCPQATIPAQAIYTFQPTKAGTYYLSFASSTKLIADTLVVK